MPSGVAGLGEAGSPGSATPATDYTRLSLSGLQPGRFAFGHGLRRFVRIQPQITAAAFAKINFLLIRMSHDRERAGRNPDVAFVAHSVVHRGHAFPALRQKPFAMGENRGRNFGAQLLDGSLPVDRSRSLLQDELLENEQICNDGTHGKLIEVA